MFDNYVNLLVGPAYRATCSSALQGVDCKKAQRELSSIKAAGEKQGSLHVAQSQLSARSADNILLLQLLLLLLLIIYLKAACESLSIHCHSGGFLFAHKAAYLFPHRAPRAPAHCGQLSQAR